METVHPMKYYAEKFGILLHDFCQAARDNGMKDANKDKLIDTQEALIIREYAK